MSGIHCLQHVEGLRAADLADNDTIGAHAQCVADEFTLGDFADTITMSNANGYAFCRGGDDTIIGGTASDSFFGGSGNDTLDGGAGSDTVNYIDDGFDIAGPGFQA